MASLVVQNAGRFTAGETVSAYPESNWPPHKRPPTGAPVGSASGTGAMDANSATITGLAADTRYYVHGATSGTYVAADTTDQISSQAVLAPHGSTHEPGGTDAMAVDAAAGTASLRSLGATGNKALPGTYLDTDVALAADSDSKVASQKATKAYVATAGGLLVPKSLVDAKGDLLAGTAADTLGRVAVGANESALIAASGEAAGVKWAEVYPWNIEINPFLTPATQTSWSSLTVGTSSLFNGYLVSSGQNAVIGWDIIMAAGTWTFTMLHSMGANRGIYTLALDAVSVGTIDGYNSTTTHNNLSTITAIAVGATGKKRVTLTMATKNASSADYLGLLVALGFRRTA